MRCNPSIQNCSAAGFGSPFLLGVAPLAVPALNAPAAILNSRLTLPVLRPPIHPYAARLMASVTKASQLSPEDFARKTGRALESFVSSVFKVPEGFPAPVPDLHSWFAVKIPFNVGAEDEFNVTLAFEMREGGKVGKFKIKFDKPFGPIPLPPSWFHEWFSILGPAGRIFLREIEALPDASPNALNGEVRVVFKWGFAKEYGQTLDSESKALKSVVKISPAAMVLKFLNITSEKLKARGLPPDRIPFDKSDVLVGLIVDAILEKKGKILGNLPLKLVPDFSRGSIDMSAEFSKRVIEFPLPFDVSRQGGEIVKMRIHFAATSAPDVFPPFPRLRTIQEKPLTGPGFEIRGIEAIELLHPDRIIRLSNARPEDSVWRFSPEFNPDDPASFRLHFESSHPSAVIGEERDGTGKRLSVLQLPRGGHVRFSIVFNDGTPALEADDASTRDSIVFDGHGVHLNIKPPDDEEVRRAQQYIKKAGPLEGEPTASLSRFRVRTKDGAVEIEGLVSGQGEGRVKLDGGLGAEDMDFRKLKGLAAFKIDKNDEGVRTRLWLKGSIEIPGFTILPSQNGFGTVASTIEKAEADFSTFMEIDPQGVVTIAEPEDWPPAILEAAGFMKKQGAPIEIKALKGVVDAMQNVGSLTGREAGPGDVRFRSHLEFLAGGGGQKPAIRFGARKLVFVPRKEFVREGEKSPPAFVLQESDVEEIGIDGALSGKAVVWAGGLILGEFVLVGLTGSLGAARLADQTVFEKDGSKKRAIRFDDILVQGEEAHSTFNIADTRRCGFGRQKITAHIPVFGFDLPSRDLVIGGLQNSEKGLSFQLMERRTGACLEVGTKPVANPAVDTRDFEKEFGGF